jgi:hypothetical protein
VISIVTVKKPPMVVLDNVAKARRIRAWQIGIERFNPVDAQIRPILQFEDIAVTGEEPSPRPFRPMHGLSLAHRFVVRIGVLNRLGSEQSVAVRVGQGLTHT